MPSCAQLRFAGACGGFIREASKDEVREALVDSDLQALAGHCVRRARSRAFSVRQVSDPVTVPDGGGGGGQLKLGQVEGAAHAVQVVDDVLCAVAPADPQPAEAVDLGKGARHDHVRVSFDQAHAAVVALDVFGIGAVEDENDVFGQAFDQARDFVVAQHRAGGIGGVGDEDQPRPFGHGVENAVDIHGALAFGHLDRVGPGGQRRDAVHGEAVGAVNDLGPGAAVGVAEKGDDFVRTGAADDPRGVEVVDLGDRLAERGVVGGRIAVQFVCGPCQRVAGRGGKPVGVFVGRELQDVIAALELAFAADIEADPVDTRFGRDGLGHGPGVVTVPGPGREAENAAAQSIALNANSPPSFMPENQRSVTVLVLV